VGRIKMKKPEWNNPIKRKIMIELLIKDYLESGDCLEAFRNMLLYGNRGYENMEFSEIENEIEEKDLDIEREFREMYWEKI